MTAPWKDSHVSNQIDGDTSRYPQPRSPHVEPTRVPFFQPESPVTPFTPSRSLSLPLLPQHSHAGAFPLEAIASVPRQYLQSDPLQAPTSPFQAASLSPQYDTHHPIPSSHLGDGDTTNAEHTEDMYPNLVELSHYHPDHANDAEVGDDLIKMFGPEQVVLDPSLRAYYESIIRDILVCMIICTSIWVVLCLALPVAGL